MPPEDAAEMLDGLMGVIGPSQTNNSSNNNSSNNTGGGGTDGDDSDEDSSLGAADTASVVQTLAVVANNVEPSVLAENQVLVQQNTTTNEILKLRFGYE